MNAVEKYVDEMLRDAAALSQNKMPVECVFFNKDTVALANKMRKGRKNMKVVTVKLDAGPMPMGLKIPRGGWPPSKGSTQTPGGSTPMGPPPAVGDAPVTVEDLV